jgi:hypothetical protein
MRKVRERRRKWLPKWLKTTYKCAYWLKIFEYYVWGPHGHLANDWSRVQLFFFNKEILDRWSASKLYSREVWEKVSFLKRGLCNCILSFQAKRVMVCKLPFRFSESMTILESPIRWRQSMLSLDAKWSDAQALKSYALVLVPGPQQRVHL